MWKSLKRWPALLALLVVLGGLAVAFAWLPYRNRVTLANCERIKKGMTEAEVEILPESTLQLGCCRENQSGVREILVWERTGSVRFLRRRRSGRTRWLSNCRFWFTSLLAAWC
jgi:hypothetical protein